MSSTPIIPLRFPGTCSTCGVALPAKTKAHWDKTERKITCLNCSAQFDDLEAPPSVETEADETTTSPSPNLIALEPQQRSPAPLTTPSPPSSGRAGASAAYEYQRRHDKREAVLDQRFGRFSGLVKFLVDDPQSTRAWAKGSAGERELAEALQRRIGDRAVLLHDRRIPRSSANIDHLAIAASGVWIIDAKTYKGRVERRDKGGWFKVDDHLYVNGRDRTKLVGGLDKQKKAVLSALVDVDVLVHTVLCFIDAEWSWFPKPFQIDGVWVTWGKALSEMIAEPGALCHDDVLRVANVLAEALAPAVREESR
jgi:hypothetical protein